MKTNITDRIQWLLTCAWLPTLVLVAASAAPALATDNRAADYRQEPPASHAKLPASLRTRELRKRDPLAPIVRIVSPLADSSVAPGESRAGAPSPSGTAFALNLEVVTRDKIAVRAKEATLAPPVFGIRHVPELEAGTNNPDFPGLFVFFDVPLITPN